MRRSRREEDFRREIEAHVALEAQSLERERGLTPQEARRLALQRFGSLATAQDRFRDARPARALGRLVQHVSHAIRSLRRQPVFSLAVVGTLAIGMGLLTSIFTLLDGFLFRPLPLPDSGRLIHIDQQWIAGGPQEASDGGWISWPD
jgi:hypothetical protein